MPVHCMMLSSQFTLIEIHRNLSFNQRDILYAWNGVVCKRFDELQREIDEV